MVKVLVAFGAPPGLECWRLLELRGALAIFKLVGGVKQEDSLIEGCLFIPPRQNFIIFETEASFHLHKLCDRLTLGKFAGFPLSAPCCSFDSVLDALRGGGSLVREAVSSARTCSTLLSPPNAELTWSVRFMTHGASRTSDELKGMVTQAADAFRAAAETAGVTLGKVQCKGADLCVVLYEEVRAALGTEGVGVAGGGGAQGSGAGAVCDTAAPLQPASGTRSTWVAVLLGDGCDASRARAVQLSLKKRPYIGNSTLPPDVSLVMTTTAEVAPHHTVYDPFCGTCGTLVAAAAVGADGVGGDVDYKTLRVGTQCRSVPKKPAKVAHAEAAAAAAAGGRSRAGGGGGVANAGGDAGTHPSGRGGGPRRFFAKALTVEGGGGTCTNASVANLSTTATTTAAAVSVSGGTAASNSATMPAISAAYPSSAASLNAVEVNFSSEGFRGPDLFLVDVSPPPPHAPWPFRVGSDAVGAAAAVAASSSSGGNCGGGGAGGRSLAPCVRGRGKGAAEWFDAVVSDPPYGIREQHTQVDRERIVAKGLHGGGDTQAATALVRRDGGGGDGEGCGVAVGAGAGVIEAGCDGGGVDSVGGEGASVEQAASAAAKGEAGVLRRKPLVPPRAAAPLATLLASVVHTIAITLKVGGVAALLLPIATGGWPDGPLERTDVWGGPQRPPQVSTLGRSAPKNADPDTYGALIVPLLWDTFEGGGGAMDVDVKSGGEEATVAGDREAAVAASGEVGVATTAGGALQLRRRFVAAVAAWREEVRSVLPHHPCLRVEAAAPQQLSTRLQRRLVLLRKVRAYDHASSVDTAPVEAPRGLLLPPTASSMCLDIETEGGVIAKSAYANYKARRQRVWESSAQHQAARGEGPRTAKAARNVAGVPVSSNAGGAGRGEDDVKGV